MEKPLLEVQTPLGMLTAEVVADPAFPGIRIRLGDEHVAVVEYRDAAYAGAVEGQPGEFPDGQIATILWRKSPQPKEYLCEHDPQVVPFAVCAECVTDEQADVEEA